MKKIRTSAIVGFALAGFFLIAFIIFTALVIHADVQPIGPNGSKIGLASLNKAFFDATGENELCYDISKYVGILPFVVVFCFGMLGLVQSIKRKSLLKADIPVYILGALYIVIAIAYFLFEFLVINYRPVLIDGVLEASYPSSHTMVAVSVMASAIIMLHILIKGKRALLIVADILCVAIAAVIETCRLLSGVHWLTDIIGALLISGLLISLFYGFVALFRKDNEKQIC